MITVPTQSVKAVAAALRHRCGVAAGDHLLVAVSGGPDSVALLRALHHLAPRRRWRLRLTAAHVHHHLRPCADDDAGFTAELASRLGLPYTRQDVHPGRDGGNLEAAARRARYRALARAAGQAGATHVATAHHADDQLETVLMRFCRGAAARGFAAIPWSRPLSTTPPLTLIRPMLAVTRAEVLDDLARLDQPYRTDPTNADTARLRNRLRRDVLPTLRAVAPSAPGRATQLAELARQHQQLLDHALRQALAHVTQHGDTCRLDRDVARGLPADGLVLAAVLRHLFTRAGVPADTLSAKSLDRITRAVRDGGGRARVFALGNRVRLELTRDQILIGRE